MKKKKGFTLVELLAVIAILAIILLIAVPLILGVIDNAKKDSFKNSTLSLFKAVELKAVKDSVTSGNIADLPMSGTKFLTGKWNYNNVDGSVTLTQVCNGEYKVDAVSSKNTDMTIIKDNGDCGFQIVVNGNNPDNVSCSAIDAYVDAGAKYDENILTSTDKVDLKYAGTYNLNYSFGKFIATRIVNVTNTNTPTLELTSDSIQLIKGSTFNASDYIKTATDPCEDDIRKKVTFESDVINDSVGTYEVIYKLKNNGNIETSKTLTVKVVSSAPVVFNYTGNIQTFTVPYTGTYKIELWGAQGGAFEYNNGALYNNGANGGYTSLEYNFNKDEIVYFTIGGRGEKGTNHDKVWRQALGGYNGGGDGGRANGNDGGGGGGATHIAKSSGTLKDLLNANKQVIGVAGGGAGLGSDYATPIGRHGNNSNPSQYNTNYLGYGETAITGYNTASGGGGGYYGGRTGQPAASGNGAGISYGGTGYTIIPGTIIPGDQTMPNPLGSDQIMGNAGNGYARITLVEFTNTVLKLKETTVAVDLYTTFKPYDYLESAIDNYDGDITDKVTIETNLNLSVEGQYEVIYVVKNSRNEERRERLLVNVKLLQYNFDYTGGIQPLTVPHNAKYKIELWGAQGGAFHYINGLHDIGGNGGYTSLEYTLNKGEIIYVVVGGKGQKGTNHNNVWKQALGGYNGGGNSGLANGNDGGGGGGATHVAKTNGTLKDILATNEQVIAVAGGGAGAHDTTKKHGVGNNKDSALYNTNYLGYGEMSNSDFNTAGGGGGGYYGGKTGPAAAYGIAPGISYGGAGYTIIPGTIISGDQIMPNPRSNETMIGNFGDGYVRITLIQ